MEGWIGKRKFVRYRAAIWCSRKRGEIQVTWWGETDGYGLVKLNS